MDRKRKRQILKAEAAFARSESLFRALAERGFYVVGAATPRDPEPPKPPVEQPLLH